MSPREKCGPHAENALLHTSTNGRSTADILFTFGRCCFLVLLLVGVVGCGGSGEGLAPVHGTVTLDGKALTEGFVFVSPADGKIAKGAIQSDGTFVLGTDSDSDGVQIGTHPVSVKPPPAQEGAPPSATAKLLPRRYTVSRTSGITVEVKPDTNNELPIKLSSK